MEPVTLQKILEILPHRYPFLLIDGVEEVDVQGLHLVAKKNVTINEHFFQGHFPQLPIMPGVLLIEALAQAGGVLAYYLGRTEGRLAVLMKVDGAKFRSPVKPGDVLYLDCTMEHLTKRAGRMAGVARVGDQVALTCTITFAFVERDQI